jgi:hypothetical protein
MKTKTYVCVGPADHTADNAHSTSTGQQQTVTWSTRMNTNGITTTPVVPREVLRSYVYQIMDNSRLYQHALIAEERKLNAPVYTL